MYSERFRCILAGMFLRWLGDNWFTLLQSIGIIGGLLFTGIALRHDARGRRITNLIALTGSHRDIWSEFSRRPELARVLDPRADLAQEGVTEAEKKFVTLIVLHLSSVYHALEDSLSVTPDGLRRDIQGLFSRPVPRAVWENIKSLQDREFVRFVEACRSEEAHARAEVS